MILQTSATMALLLAVGWLARRSGRLTETTMRELSALVVDVAFPALVLVQLPRTVDAATLAARWYVPVLGAVTIATSLAVGHLVSRFGGGGPVRRRTLAFLVGTPNWIFFPLPIAEGLYGAEGVQSVLLLNVGAQLVFWTLGVLTLRGRMSRTDAARGLLRNPGLWATLAGAALAFVQWPLPEGVFGVFAHAAVDAAALLGGLAVPLSFLVAGMQFRLGEGREAGAPPARREMAALLLGRLVAAPAVFVALSYALAPALGVPRAAVPVQVACLVAVMPVAVTCGPLAERLGGDASFAARAIVFSTLVALVSVPATMGFLRFLGG